MEKTIDKEATTSYWIRESQEDIPVAEHLYAAGDYLCRLFICHLFIEKALKALVVAHTGEHAPPMHNLIRLAEIGRAQPDSERADVLRELMRFKIEARYPRDREALRKICDRTYAGNKLETAREFAAWIIAETKFNAR